MNETHTQIGAHRIAVYDSGGSGPPVLLIHGNSTDARTFQHQFDSPLARSHRLVAFDLPGHGHSPPAANPQETYSLPALAAITVDLLERMQLTAPVIAGWSIGGHIALEAVSQLPHAAGFLIYGAPPIAFPPAMEHAFLPNPHAAIAFAPTVDEQQATAFASAFMRPGVAAPPSFSQTILNTDGLARSHVGASVMAGNYSDEAHVVANMTAPLAVIHGAEDQIVNLDYLQGLQMPTLWRGAVQIIANAGHAPHWEQPQQFNTLLASFVSQLFP